MRNAEPILLPAPITGAPSSSLNKWGREYASFHRLLPDLLKTHEGQFVAIHEGKVIASGSDKLDVAFQALN